MHGTRASLKAIASLLLSLACVTARADPLGFYVGAAAGKGQPQSDINLSIFGLPPSVPAVPFSFPSSANGWKLFVGIKPVSFLGGEAEYIDFGSYSGSASVAPSVVAGGVTATASTHSTAGALFALGYLPIPVPFLDVFAKAGAAHLRSSVSANAQAQCPLNVPCLPIVIPPYSASHNSTGFAYGAGVQLRLASVGVRGEYERTSTSGGDADLLSLGVIWRF